MTVMNAPVRARSRSISVAEAEPVRLFQTHPTVASMTSSSAIEISKVAPRAFVIVYGLMP